MVEAAPRLSPRIHAAVLAAHDPRLPIAEICRRVGSAAEQDGLPRPSYETVRRLVHALRRLSLDPTTAQVLIDVAFRARPPEALLDHLAGIGVPRRP